MQNVECGAAIEFRNWGILGLWNWGGIERL
jgi:hypothetical protein